MMEYPDTCMFAEYRVLYHVVVELYCDCYSRAHINNPQCNIRHSHIPPPPALSVATVSGVILVIYNETD